MRWGLFFLGGILAATTGALPLLAWGGNLFTGRTGPTLLGWLLLFVWMAAAFSLAGWCFSHVYGPAACGPSGDSRAAGGSEAAPGVCPQCQAPALVRGIQEYAWFRQRFWGRCLECGERIVLTPDEWEALPWADIRSPHETWEDRLALMRSLPMARGQTLCVLVGLAVGLALVAFTVSQPRWGVFGDDIATAILLLTVGTSWWVGYTLFGQRRKHAHQCAVCGYDLRGCVEPRCPECGTQFGASVGGDDSGCET